MKWCLFHFAGSALQQPSLWEDHDGFGLLISKTNNVAMQTELFRRNLRVLSWSRNCGPSQALGQLPENLLD